MKPKKSDFQFLWLNHGRYEVTYQSPKTFKSYSGETTNMPLIDAVQNVESPKLKDLYSLMRIAKGG